MMHTLSLLLFALSLSAHAKDTKIFCEDEGGGHKTPKLMVKAGGGHTLFLCSTNEKSRGGKIEASGFRIFSLKGAKKSRVFQSEDERVQYWASKQGEALALQELISTGTGRIPTFALKIECNEHGCKAGSPTCALETPKGSSTALSEIREYQSGSKRGKVPRKQLIDRLAAIAYGGDKDAQAIFKDRGTLSLDGDASDVYFDHQAALDRLKKAGCLKP